MQNAKTYKAAIAPSGEPCKFGQCRRPAAILLTTVERYKEAGKEHKITAEDLVCADHLDEFYPEEAYRAYQEATSPVALPHASGVHLKGVEEVAD